MFDFAIFMKTHENKCHKNTCKKHLYPPTKTFLLPILFLFESTQLNPLRLNSFKKNQE